MSANGTSRHSRRCNIAGRYWGNSGHWPEPALGWFGQLIDAVDGARSAASECYSVVALKRE